MSQTFDFIIVGGGTAGIVLTSRLSLALPQLSFLLIEAGIENDQRLEPSQGYHAGQDPSIEWDHSTVPQKGLGGKVIKQVQGKILGGSSAINVQGWTRGPRADFDQWAELVGDEKWSWEGLLEYFKKCETFYPAESNTVDLRRWHGFEGLIKVAQPSNSGKPRNYPLKSMVFQAYESVRVNWLPDCGTGEILGYCECTQNTYDGKRYYAANSYKLGENVTVWTRCVAEKLVVEGMRAVGVEALRMPCGERAMVMASKEVIVCSGVQGSAKLLLLSGIGPNEELSKHGITQVLDLPVGENYSDHPFFHTFWKVRDRGLSLGDMPMITQECDWTAGLPGDATAWHRHDDIMSKYGKHLDPRTYDLLTAPGKVHTESFVIYGHVDLTRTGEPNPGGSVLQMCNMLVSPTSRGTLKLRSSNPSDPPILDPNLLSNELDTQLLYACGRLTISMMQGPVGQEYGAREYGIDESIRDDFSDDAMQKRLFYASRSLNHGSGTCAMRSVVDAECRVKGLEGVRVIDASIFPNPLGAHYQAAVYAIAEMMADVIMKRTQSGGAAARIHPLPLLD